MHFQFLLLFKCFISISCTSSPPCSPIIRLVFHALLVFFVIQYFISQSRAWLPSVWTGVKLRLISICVATKICISTYYEATAKWFYIVFLSVVLLLWCFVSIQLSSCFCLRLFTIYFSLVCSLFLLDNFHYHLISTKSVISLVFASVMFFFV